MCSIYEKRYYSIDRLLKDVNDLQVRTGKNPSTPLYNEVKNVLNKKNVKTTKRERASKGFASTHNVKILNSLNPELQLKDTESAIKNKLKEILSQL